VFFRVFAIVKFRLFCDVFIRDRCSHCLCRINVCKVIIFFYMASSPAVSAVFFFLNILLLTWFYV
jgi:hypothetical protein